MFSSACVSDDLWHVSDHPTASDAELLLTATDPVSIRREYLVNEVPAIPVRENLRPCCAFGAEIRATLGPIPIPFYEIPNIVDLDTIGPHTYDSGVIHTPKKGAAEFAIDRESNGLVYTCRGGFVDVAHVRDYLDWSLYLASEIARLIVAGEAGAIELPDEGGGRRVVVHIPDPDVIERVGVRRLVLWLAEWTAWQISVWHETATWFGWGAVPGFSEQASAFSPEDLFSNGLGIRMLPAVVYRGAERSESLFNTAATVWIRATLKMLEAVPVDVGRLAARAVDGHWWDSTQRVPNKALVKRRSFDYPGVVRPWLVPASLAPAELVAACGENPEPVLLKAPDRTEDVIFADWVTLEIRPSDDLREQVPFTSYGPVITQQDLPALVAEVRKQNLAQFGERADRPD